MSDITILTDVGARVLEKEYEDYWKAKGECYGYSTSRCPNCGRMRVEHYQNGDLICEKCNWNSTTRQYEKTYI